MEMYTYVDTNNDRIQILDYSLNPIREVTHPSMHRPRDVKLTTEDMYVLSLGDSPCMHVFNHTGHKIHSLITRGVGMQVAGPSLLLSRHQKEFNYQ